MKTFETPVEISGVGLNSGNPVNVRILPSDRPGIFFKRTDIKDSHLLPATYDNVFNSNRWDTTIGKEPDCVRLIEHFMASLAIAGIGAAIIEIDGPEVPILDGSAKGFLDIFAKAKMREIGQTKKIIVKREVVAYRREIIKKLPLIKRFLLWLHNLKTGRREDGYVRLAPSGKGLRIIATMDYPDKIIGKQSYEYLFDGTEKSRKKFMTGISKSRSFGRVWEWEYLKKRGMGHGATMENILVINNAGDGTLNELYHADEFVRHKIIDALGDMYTSGGMIIGELESYKGSHGLNNLVLRKLFQDPNNYEIVMEGK